MSIGLRERLSSLKLASDDAAALQRPKLRKQPERARPVCNGWAHVAAEALRSQGVYILRYRECDAIKD